VKEKFDIVTPELDDDHVRLAHKIQNLTLDEIKNRIPRVVYSGILLSADILYNDHLRGRDMKKKKEAAAVFLEKLGNANLLKNLAVLSAGKEDHENKKSKSVEWSGEEK
jgi:hypothetical protein